MLRHQALHHLVDHLQLAPHQAHRQQVHHLELRRVHLQGHLLMQPPRAHRLGHFHHLVLGHRLVHQRQVRLHQGIHHIHTCHMQCHHMECHHTHTMPHHRIFHPTARRRLVHPTHLRRVRWVHHLTLHRTALGQGHPIIHHPMVSLAIRPFLAIRHPLRLDFLRRIQTQGMQSRDQALHLAQRLQDIRQVGQLDHYGGNLRSAPDKERERDRSRRRRRSDRDAERKETPASPAQQYGAGFNAPAGSGPYITKRAEPGKPVSIDTLLAEIRQSTAQYASTGAHCCLEMLDVCGIALQDSGAAKLFQEMTQLRVAVRRLMVAGNGLGDQAMTALSAYLWHSPEPLWELGLADNFITDKGLEELLRCLYNHPSHPPRFPDAQGGNTGSAFALRRETRCDGTRVLLLGRGG
ncbi:unnamed protein product [Cladocopium goreaui]|uniref:Adhesive plaque matrix protein n=1 Tax=Cladocopium goreaui TaxID=2562237 RepID=A0A9P1C3L7_9DINO|nr:unnamed protein product [Cladocopium goreaui]